MRAIKINGTKVKIWARSLDIYGWEQVMNTAFNIIYGINSLNM